MILSMCDDKNIHQLCHLISDVEKWAFYMLILLEDIPYILKDIPYYLIQNNNNFCTKHKCQRVDLRRLFINLILSGYE
jgi:hypothetical protein